MEQVTSESSQELLAHLEELTGRSVRTRADIRAYVEEVDAATRLRMSRVASSWNTAKHTAELTLLLFAFLQYYVADVLLQIVSLPQIAVFVPVVSPDIRSAVELISRLV